MKNVLKKQIINYLKILEHTLAGFAIIVILYYLLFDFSIIVSNSMSPTLQGSSPTSGDWILSEKISYLFRNPRRWEIVAFRSKTGVQVMKRVVALPGEKISLSKKTVWINGNAIQLPSTLSFLKYYAFGNLHNSHKFNCIDGYYLFGDNSRDSDDSRFNGTIPKSAIIAHPLLRIWPLDRIGWIN